MASTYRKQHVDRLLAKMACAWSEGAWANVSELAAEALDFEPDNEDAAAYLRAARARGRRELQRMVSTLDCLPVLAFLTDSLNRLQWVNRNFAYTIGDPIKQNLPEALRFLPAAIAGPFRDSFPRWKEELSSCLSGLHREVEAGHLGAGTLRLIDDTLCRETELRRGVENCDEWDGTMLVLLPDGKRMLVREHVLPLHDAGGHPTGLHVSQWFPVDTPLPAGAEGESGDIATLLTPRQLEIARLFASGRTAEQVAAAAGIASRTARDHLEEIYSRLDVHSRAELTLLMAHSGVI